MRRLLDWLYRLTGVLAALFMVGCLSMVLASVLGRLLNFHLRGADSYAGYCMAAAGFLALAHTLKRGEHIRVTLFLDRLGVAGKRWLEIAAHSIGLFFAGLFAVFATRLVYQSFVFNDISQGNDATPLWIPQIGMALGAIVLFIGVLDELILHIVRRHTAVQPDTFKPIE